MEIIRELALITVVVFIAAAISADAEEPDITIQAAIVRELAKAEKVEAVDADGDGVITLKDADILAGKFNALFDEFMSLLGKAGIAGGIDKKDAQNKIRTNLTSAEQKRLQQVNSDVKKLAEQIEATLANLETQLHKIRANSTPAEQKRLQQLSSDARKLVERIKQIKTTLADMETQLHSQPVDADGDGVITLKDADILAGKFHALLDELMSLLDKAGVERDKEGHVIDKEDTQSKIRANLTPTEQERLQQVNSELEKLDEQIQATLANLGTKLHSQPVDANGDGVIDANDFKILMTKANTLFAEKIRPLIYKAGIKTDEKGKLIDENPQSRIEANLTPAEQRRLKEAISEWEEVSAQMRATMIKTLKD